MNFAEVDKSRINLIAQLTQDQKDMFLIVMCYHSAFLIMQEIRAGKNASMS